MITQRSKIRSRFNNFIASTLVAYLHFSSANEFQPPESGNEAHTQTPVQAHPLKPPGKMTEAVAEFEAKNPPQYTVQVYRKFPGEKLTEPEERTLQNLCNILMKHKPEPAERLAYFSWIKDEACPIRFRSWGCMIREAKPVDGGWVVTLQAMARATDAEAHPHVVYDRFIETYEVSNLGEIRYVRGQPHPEDGGAKPHFRRVSGL